MRTTERVTVTLPREMLRDIAQIEPNRSRFVVEAVHHELRRRKYDELKRSLRSPHPESASLAEARLQGWAQDLEDEEISELVDLSTGRAVRWVPGKGWVERR